MMEPDKANKGCVVGADGNRGRELFAQGDRGWLGQSWGLKSDLRDSKGVQLIKAWPKVSLIFYYQVSQSLKPFSMDVVN